MEEDISTECKNCRKVLSVRVDQSDSKEIRDFKIRRLKEAARMHCKPNQEPR